MNFIQRKYWLSNLVFFLLLLSCSNESEKTAVSLNQIENEELEAKKNIVTKNETLKNVNNVLPTQKDSLVKKKSKKVKEIHQSNKNQVAINQPSVPDFVMITEEEYWKWRKGKGYFNDSIGQRKNFKEIIQYKFPELDSLEFEKKWRHRWFERYIKKIEENNVIWDSIKK